MLYDIPCCGGCCERMEISCAEHSYPQKGLAFPQTHFQILRSAGSLRSDYKPQGHGNCVILFKEWNGVRGSQSWSCSQSLGPRIPNLEPGENLRKITGKITLNMNSLLNSSKSLLKTRDSSENQVFFFTDSTGVEGRYHSLYLTRGQLLRSHLSRRSRLER